MIPVIIVLAGLVIAVAAGIYERERKKSAEDQAKKATEAATTLEKAIEAGQYISMAAPGLERETSLLTSHIAAFEQVVDPTTDLTYAKKLTGEIPGTLPPAATAPTIPPAELDEKKGLTELVTLARKAGLIRVPRSGVDPEEAAASLAGHGAAGMTSLALAHTAGIIAEASSLGQMESVMWTIMDLLNASGLPDIVKASTLTPYEISVLGPARYHYNQVYTPVRPDMRALPLLLARRQITEEEYLTLSAYQGLDGRWAAGAWNSFLRLPEFRELQIMRWRGLIDDTAFKDVLLRLGWHPDVVDEMLNLAWLIPGPDDLIRFVVREVIPPSEFIVQMEKQGYGPGWAGAYWTAHFRLPSPEHLIEAYHRKIINLAELRKFIFWHDYIPEARPDIRISDLEIMKGLTKTLIPRVDVRRGWAQGALNDAQLLERYEFLGYEDDAPLMAEIQKTIALTPERSALARVYLSALRKGLRTETEVRARLAALKLPEKAIDYLLEVEATRREIGDIEPAEEPRILGTSHILAAYKKRLFTREATLALLVGQGWDPSAADVLILVNEPTPEEVKPISEVRTAAAALYREGWATAEEFEGLLRAANYTEEDIARVRQAEDLRYRLDFVKDLEATAIEALRRDVYTAEDLEAYLLELGKVRERIWPLVAKELFKKLPKPKPAAA